MCWCCLIWNCHSQAGPKQISRIEYSYISGSILPELQLQELFLISPDRVSLIRKGPSPDSQVNSGEWELPFTRADLDELFQQLAGVDMEKIEPLAPEDAPEGGYTTVYSLFYTDGTVVSLFYLPGTTYTGGETLTRPIDNFIRKLSMPPQASPQYLD